MFLCFLMKTLHNFSKWTTFTSKLLKLIKQSTLKMMIYTLNRQNCLIIKKKILSISLPIVHVDPVFLSTLQQHSIQHFYNP